MPVRACPECNSFACSAELLACLTDWLPACLLMVTFAYIVVGESSDGVTDCLDISYQGIR